MTQTDLLAASAPPVLDSDPQETAEWLEALDDVLRCAGPERARELLARLTERARHSGVVTETLLNTPCCNTIAVDQQPPYPGDLAMERRVTGLIRWNALAMVMRSNRESSELGGHLASYASSADLFEVGFNHFFHGNREVDLPLRTADMVFFQPHSAPGVYARAYLEGRLSELHLERFRSETGGQVCMSLLESGRGFGSPVERRSRTCRQLDHLLGWTFTRRAFRSA
jgi:pyruvate dehydrogenase E1 component